MPQKLSRDDWNTLMRIASDSVYAAAHRRRPEPLQLELLPETLRQNGAVFVTLTKSGELRGCIGSLEAWQPLAEDVQLRAYQAAVQDSRFPPLSPAELPMIEIEISRLTPPEPLIYDSPAWGLCSCLCFPPFWASEIPLTELIGTTAADVSLARCSASAGTAPRFLPERLPAVALSKSRRQLFRQSDAVKPADQNPALAR